ncbi:MULTISPECIES: GntT/GntP/DsdX family permease [Fusobacterium]|jgi:H+/gluconate symporter-like permease|uniref:Citrate transporter n=1 Tax=Fusobacterium varium ATCC 27725 TaxID=469618 RepID=A0ABM6U4J4_FUSVA|nr:MULTISPECIES: Na+/H+ antiporter NhaC family protein [Fusobacterium]AVQ31210.1 citrate transporter [Fusobacterium varium ATCC 27725]EES62528.1 citrate transporter [Fusobacterium varium ATCC 27725]MCI6031388.1 TRAP transporter large permease subunit [Fusobacterium varium]MDY4004872.1 TRAP transporter large permease subunit [Fusobacterium varium]RGJ30842.1 citrate transporter [Fusobacterium varium]
MIFGLPALIGFLPLVIYLYLAFKGKNLLSTVIICVLVGAVLTGQTPVSLSNEIANGLKSFLGLIGFIIMMGAGLGEVLTETKVARNLVEILIKKVGIKSQNQAIIVTMGTSTLLVSLLGTLAGANAMIAPILIPIVASFGLTPNALAVILHGAGACGLFLGPFVPPVITLMGITGLTYGAYLANVGIPVTILVLITTYYTGKKVQKQYEGIEVYSAEDMDRDEEFRSTPEIDKATMVFAIVMIGMLAYGIYAKAGAAYAIVVMLAVAFTTGLTAGRSMMDIIGSLTKGATRMFWLFFMFVLYDPFLKFVTMTGAFTTLGDMLKPLIEVSGDIGFIIISTLVGIFGVSGAAVAQSVVLNDLFKNIVADINLPMTIWGTVLLIGSQITSFAYPTGDMIGQMGLARSKDLKSMIRNGISITIVMIIYVIVRAVIYSI